MAPKKVSDPKAAKKAPATPTTAKKQPKAKKPVVKTVDTPGTDIMTLKVSLEGSRPPIWRRFQVRSTTTFGELHNNLISVMGWDDSHLHSFRGDGIEEEEDYDFDPRKMDAHLARVHATPISACFTAPKKRCLYTYDFGDRWRHCVELEGTVAAEPNVSYPRCIKGKGACPPEDCGGICGFDAVLDLFKDPPVEDADEHLRQWVKEMCGDDYDPAHFDPTEVCF